MARADNHDGDINRLNVTWYIAGAEDFERPCLLFPRRVSHTLLPPDAIVPYLRETGFGDALPLKDFVFDNSLITAFVEHWRQRPTPSICHGVNAPTRTSHTTSGCALIKCPWVVTFVTFTRGTVPGAG
ncbi:hypothetical protein Ahy_A04g020213 [Arachis hypogaea]|uniref:Aminotransferase-like plant mobile domain-containing protein n=1 Tax=Arachis hypogaea TaxID=3818 RepID=A0A445DH93_ARAHY|nr:hypothetical protein Ahy_A04g020213 [Arachis hypogaea]